VAQIDGDRTGADGQPPICGPLVKADDLMTDSRCNLQNAPVSPSDPAEMTI
jgi:hypothetical protein